jgi:hypothetical protein
MAGSLACWDRYLLLLNAISSVPSLGPAAGDNKMKTSKDLADWILGEIAHINPYTSRDKLKAFIWASGFLARCCAEMIWRDNHNLAIFQRIIKRNRR